MDAVSRRAVVKGAAVTCGVGLLASCGGGGDDSTAAPTAESSGSAGGGAPSGSDSGAAPLARLDTVPVGGALAVTAPDGAKLLLTRPSDGEAVAFSAVCPHQGCTVAPDDAQLSCPCHGSQFELSGEVKQGPAARPLTPYPVRVEDGQVLPA